MDTRGVKAQNEAAESLYCSRIFDEKQDPDTYQSVKSDPDPMRIINVKRGIRIRTNVMRIRNNVKTRDPDPHQSYADPNRCLLG
jgi:hypothetical protein